MQIKSVITTIAALILLLTCISPAKAESMAERALRTAPQHVFPLIEKTTVLDMLDYYKSNMTTPSANRIGGKARITAIAPDNLKMKQTEDSETQIVVLTARRDTIIAVIETLHTPQPDSNITFYTKDWSKTLNADGKILKMPESTDQWLSAAGKKDKATVKETVPFILASAEYDNGILTLTNQTAGMLSADDAAKVRPLLADTLQFVWDGAKGRLKFSSVRH